MGTHHRILSCFCFLPKSNLGADVNFPLSVFISTGLQLQLFIKELDILLCSCKYSVLIIQPEAFNANPGHRRAPTVNHFYFQMYPKIAPPTLQPEKEILILLLVLWPTSFFCSESSEALGIAIYLADTKMEPLVLFLYSSLKEGARLAAEQQVIKQRKTRMALYLLRYCRCTICWIYFR